MKLYLLLSLTLGTSVARGEIGHYRCYCSENGQYSWSATQDVCSTVGGQMVTVRYGDECKLPNRNPRTTKFIRVISNAFIHEY
ncbi:hypothetical protein LZ30DRAFT_733437 [Colletotrichum cereale]|nr:hypothetical protein LZ30DRAFT_733437 [Colletotrichum cereale]